MPTLRLTDDERADALLSENPLALLIGMLLDQQVAMEHAFAGPLKIADRVVERGLGDALDAATIADADPEVFDELARETPAIHRYPGSMAKRVQALCQTIVEDYDGDAEAIWRDVETGKELFRRLTALPGYGKQKAQIFVALLAKQLDVRPDGWEAVAGSYAEDGHRSIADVTSPETLAKVRDFKREMKARKKAAAKP